MKREREQHDDAAAYDDMGLSTEFQDPLAIEAYLRESGFLDPTMGVREFHAARDPVLGMMYNPTLPLNDGATTIIDHLLTHAHQLLIRTYGSTYTEFTLIMDTMQLLLASKDTRSKQIMLLFMVGIDEGLQQQMQRMYNSQGTERKRFPKFMTVLRNEMAAVLNTAFVNIPNQRYHHPYNVDTLSKHFLRQICAGYPAI